MSDATLIVALEGLLIFGGMLAFGLWQLRSIRKDQEKARKEKLAANPPTDPQKAGQKDER